MPQLVHPDAEVRDAFRRLVNALVCWERNTSRSSILIFREAAGNPCAEGGPMPSAVAIRLMDGVSVDPSNADLTDVHLLTAVGGGERGTDQ